MSIDSTIEASMEASFFALFSATLGTSVTTGYDWTEVSESTKNEQITVEVKASVRPGYILQIKQATGKKISERDRFQIGWVDFFLSYFILIFHPKQPKHHLK